MQETLAKPIEFTDLVYWEGHRLLACPDCLDGYLHHTTVDVFERLRGEDGDSFRFRLDGHQLETSLVPNAPGRRNSIEIRFWCENCSLDKEGNPARFFVLQILQHKGNTYLSWVREEDGNLEIW